MTENNKDNNKNIFVQFLEWCKRNLFTPYMLLLFMFCIAFSQFIYYQKHKTDSAFLEIINNIKNEIDIKKKSNFANMIYPRYYHTATKLNDGNIIFIGGGSKFSEIYDTKNNQFIKGAECKYDRYMHNVVKLSNGNLLIIGGHDEKNPSQEIYDVEIYDWKKQKFSVFTKLNKSLFCPQSVIFNQNYIVVFSSKISHNNQYSGLPEIINLKTQTAKIIKDFPIDYITYFNLPIFLINADNNILFFKLDKELKNSKNLLWNGKIFIETNTYEFFTKGWSMICPMDNNIIFYTKSVYENSKNFYKIGKFNIKTGENKELINHQQNKKYDSFTPSVIMPIGYNKIVIAGGKTHIPKVKTQYSKDVFLYEKDKIKKIGLLYNKSLINFTISDVKNNEILICGGRFLNTNDKSSNNKYEQTNKCQFINYKKE